MADLYCKALSNSMVVESHVYRRWMSPWEWFVDGHPFGWTQVCLPVRLYRTRNVGYLWDSYIWFFNLNWRRLDLSQTGLVGHVFFFLGRRTAFRQVAGRPGLTTLQGIRVFRTTITKGFALQNQVNIQFVVWFWKARV